MFQKSKIKNKWDILYIDMKILLSLINYIEMAIRFRVDYFSTQSVYISEREIYNCLVLVRAREILSLMSIVMLIKFFSIVSESADKRVSGSVREWNLNKQLTVTVLC